MYLRGKGMVVEVLIAMTAAATVMTIQPGQVGAYVLTLQTPLRTLSQIGQMQYLNLARSLVAGRLRVENAIADRAQATPNQAQATPEVGHKIGVSPALVALSPGAPWHLAYVQPLYDLSAVLFFERKS